MNEKIVGFFNLRVEKGMIGNCPDSAQILLKNAEFLSALLNGRFQIMAFYKLSPKPQTGELWRTASAL